MSVLIATDLDGSLLDHHSYQGDQLLPLLQRLRAAGHVIVANTSKTAAETERCCRELGLDAPYVVENGAAIHAADGHMLASSGRPREDILQCLNQLYPEAQRPFIGFSQAGHEQISQWTGLDEQAARRANQRAWSEPLYWLGSDRELAELGARLAEQQLSFQRGGRFVSVQGQHDKSTALKMLQRSLKLSRLLALGDGANDLPMLALADRGVLIRSPVNPFPETDIPPRRLLRTAGCGPQGWAEAMNTLRAEGWLDYE